MSPRFAIAILILAPFLASVHRAGADTPTPRDVACPLCDEHFVYVGLGHFVETSVKTCPWCLFSATAPHITTVHPDDADSLRGALATADQSLNDMSQRAVGMNFTQYVGDPPNLYAVQKLLAMICAGARRDLKVDSVAMIWIVMSGQDTPSGPFVRQRLLDAMKREIDGPFDVSRFRDKREAAAVSERLAIERREHIAMLHLEFGEHDEADAILKRVIELVDAWDAEYRDSGFAWANQVRMIADRAIEVLNQPIASRRQVMHENDADDARTARLEIAERSLERALAEPLYQEVTVSLLELGHESPFGFRKDELADILPTETEFEALDVGDRILLPRVPLLYMSTRWPAWSMWRELDELIENESDVAAKTLIRWLPTLGEKQLRFDSGRDEFFGRILDAIHDHPELWRIVIDAQPDVEGRLQTTCHRAIRACAGDEQAVTQLTESMHGQKEWGTSASVSLVALSICRDRSLLEAAIEKFAAADSRIQRAIGGYIAAVGEADDLPHLARAAEQIRAQLAPDGARAAPEMSLFAINRFESAIREIRLRSLYEATLNHN